MQGNAEVLKIAMPSDLALIALVGILECAIVVCDSAPSTVPEPIAATLAIALALAIAMKAKNPSSGVATGVPE